MHDLVFFYPDRHEAHFELGHPERPERVEAIRDALLEKDWWNTFPHLDPIAPSLEVLSAIHEMSYLRTLEAACSQGRHLDMDTYTTTASWQLAHNSAGGAMAVAKSVWQRTAKRGSRFAAHLGITPPSSVVWDFV